MDNLFDEEQVRRAMPAAFRVALRVLESWGYSPDEMALVLGLSPEQIRRYWATGLAEMTVTEDLTVRVSLILGIERALEILLSEENEIRNWMNQRSNAPIFNGESPKSVMKSGELVDLCDVHAYLNGWLSGDFS